MGTLSTELNYSLFPWLLLYKILVIACGVGPRHAINFMSQLWKKEVDFRLKMAIFGLKLP